MTPAELFRPVNEGALQDATKPILLPVGDDHSSP